MKKFDTEEEATAWVVYYVDDPYIDNERFSFIDDVVGMKKYEAQFKRGCCGEFDARVMVGGRLATIGCNYGH